MKDGKSSAFTTEEFWEFVGKQDKRTQLSLLSFIAKRDYKFAFTPEMLKWANENGPYMASLA